MDTPMGGNMADGLANVDISPNSLFKSFTAFQTGTAFAGVMATSTHGHDHVNEQQLVQQQMGQPDETSFFNDNLASLGRKGENKMKGKMISLLSEDEISGILFSFETFEDLHNFAITNRGIYAVFLRYKKLIYTNLFERIYAQENAWEGAQNLIRANRLTMVGLIQAYSGEQSEDIIRRKIQEAPFFLEDTAEIDIFLSYHSFLTGILTLINSYHRCQSSCKCKIEVKDCYMVMWAFIAATNVEDFKKKIGEEKLPVFSRYHDLFDRLAHGLNWRMDMLSKKWIFGLCYTNTFLGLEF